MFAALLCGNCINGAKGRGTIPPPPMCMLTLEDDTRVYRLNRLEGVAGRNMKHTVSLKQNHEFRRLYHKGKNAVSPYFAIYCRKTPRAYSRLGITAGVKLGNAVKRNYAKRRIRALYRSYEGQLVAGYDIVVVARTRILHGKYAELEKNFLHLMDKLGMLKREEKP